MSLVEQIIEAASLLEFINSDIKIYMMLFKKNFYNTFLKRLIIKDIYLNGIR